MISVPKVNNSRKHSEWMVSHGIRLVHAAGKDQAMKYITENIYMQHNPRFRILASIVETEKLVEFVSIIAITLLTMLDQMCTREITFHTYPYF